MIDHTGVWMIDPEFAMYGPMGFDVGKFHANLMLMLFATHGHERTKPAQKQQYVEQRGGRECPWSWDSVPFVQSFCAAVGTCSYCIATSKSMLLVVERVSKDSSR
eukprot:scaffold44097_cov18-Tisochrysis_lutea.AAC.5